MRSLYTTLPFLLFFLTGCFEVREEVDLYADGSGRVAFTINLSESRDKVANYMRLGTWNGREVPTREEIQDEVGHLKKVLASCKGMSEVRSYSDFDRFIFSLSGRFDEVRNLDAAVDRLVAAVQYETRLAQPHLHFGYSSGTFRRYFEYPLELINFEELTSMQRYMLESARMVSVYRFQKPVREFSHPEAQLAPNQRAIKLEVALGEMMRGSGTLANAIGF